MKIDVDRAKCCGAGQCVLAAPAVFDQDDDGTVILLTEHPARDDAVRAAATLCPAAAITISE